MRRTFFHIAVIAACLFFATVLPAAAEKINYDKTAEYMQEIRLKADFPVDPTFAYYYGYTMKALGKEVDQKTAAEIVEFISQTQKADGGFSENKSGTTSSSLYAYYSLKTLALFKALPKINAEKAINYLVSLQNKDGGFGFNRGSKSSLPTTYYALTGLSLLNAQGRIDRARAASYVMKLKSGSNGFALYEGKPATDKATCWATASLVILGALDDTLKRQIIDFLKTSRYSGNAAEKYEANAKIEDASLTYMTLKSLNGISVINKKKVQAFIEKLYIPQNGGFGPSPDIGSTPPSTYHAVSALASLGVLADPEGPAR